MAASRRSAKSRALEGALPATSRRSSRSRCRARCRTGSPFTTFASTPRPAWSGARPARSRRSLSSGRVRFARRCQGCPLRRRCTTAKGGRTIHLHAHEDELRAARRRAMTRTFQHSYRRWRPMVELIDRLAGRRRLPAGALPRHPAQRPVVVAAGRRGQPAPAAGAWPCPPRWCLGAGLTRSALACASTWPPTTAADLAGRPPPALSQRTSAPDRTRHLQQAPSEASPPRTAEYRSGWCGRITGIVGTVGPSVSSCWGCHGDGGVQRQRGARRPCISRPGVPGSHLPERLRAEPAGGWAGGRL